MLTINEKIEGPSQQIRASKRETEIAGYKVSKDRLTILVSRDVTDILWLYSVWPYTRYLADVIISISNFSILQVIPREINSCFTKRNKLFFLLSLSKRDINKRRCFTKMHGAVPSTAPLSKFHE